MTEQFSNNAQTTLNGSITNITTTVVVTDASDFPSVGTFRILIDSEIFVVNSVSGNTFTVAARPSENTSNVAHSSGAIVTAIVTSGAMAQLKTDVIAASTPWHTVPRVTKTGAYTVLATDYLIVCMTNTGFQILLPASPNDGDTYAISNQAAGANTVGGNTGHTINGAATYSLGQYESIIVTYDSADGIWIVT